MKPTTGVADRVGDANHEPKMNMVTPITAAATNPIATIIGGIVKPAAVTKAEAALTRARDRRADAGERLTEAQRAARKAEALGETRAILDAKREVAAIDPEIVEARDRLQDARASWAGQVNDALAPAVQAYLVELDVIAGRIAAISTDVGVAIRHAAVNGIDAPHLPRAFGFAAWMAEELRRASSSRQHPEGRS